MLTARDVARYFLAIQDEDAGELITNLKLQKLCYYAQGFHLALYDTPLFEESIEAWKHGPVIEVLWRDYNKYGYQPIPRPSDVDFDIFDEDTKSFLNEVYSVYGQFSAWKLRSMTHEEPPWQSVQETGGEITHASMREYFATLVEQ